MNLISGLDKPALICSAIFLFLFLIRKNKMAFVLILELIVLSNWHLYFKDFAALISIYDAFTVIFSLFCVYIFKSNFLLFLAQLYFMIFNLASHAVNTLYFYFDQSVILYTVSIFLYNIYLVYVFIPFLIVNALGLIFREDNDGGNRINRNANNFARHNVVLHDIHDDRYLGYHEKRF